MLPNEAQRNFMAMRLSSSCRSSAVRKQDGVFLQRKYSCSNGALTGECKNKIPGLFILKENHKIEEVINVFRMDNEDDS